MFFWIHSECFLLVVLLYYNGTFFNWLLHDAQPGFDIVCCCSGRAQSSEAVRVELLAVRAGSSQLLALLQRLLQQGESGS